MSSLTAAVVVNTALRPQKPDGLLGTERAPLTSSDTQSRELSEVGKERKHWALRPQKPLRLIRDGEVGGSGILYLTPTRYAVTTRMILH